MTRFTARLPDDLVKNIDDAARSLNRSRAEIIRQAIEYYLADVNDLHLALESLKDPSDPILDWDEVKSDLLTAD
jgi:RHH-type rel operon transcriptional repressor/antitoxin RelB